MGYDLFTNLVFERSCLPYVTMIQLLFLLHLGSRILALIALVVEFPAFSTNLLQEKTTSFAACRTHLVQSGQKRTGLLFHFYY